MTLISNLTKRVLTRQYKFEDGQLGKVLESKDSKQYIVYRNLRNRDFSGLNEYSAIFIVTFRFANFPLAVNKVLSMIPSPFLIAKTGFFQKIWASTADGHFMGLYQWKTAEDAYDYPNSFIFKIMTKRATKDSVMYKIIENKKIEEVLEDLKAKVD